MTCPGYRPVFTKQLDGSQFAGFNCTAASAAMAANDDTCGRIDPSASTVRTWTGDRTGGLNLAQVDAALLTHTGVNLDVRYRLPWATFLQMVQRGQGAILQGWYAPIRDSRFRGSESFGGNHAIYVNPGLIVEDPLADGRRAGIYKYHGEAYPESLLRSFAGKLNIASPGYYALGDGLCYAAFTRDNEPDYKAVLHPVPPAKVLEYFVYTVRNGVIVARNIDSTTGFTVSAVTAPKLYRWSTLHPATSLIQFLTGSKKGQYVQSIYARAK